MVESGLLAGKGGIVLHVGLEPFKHVSDRASVIVAEPAGDVDASFAPKPRKNPCLPAAVCLPRRLNLVSMYRSDPLSFVPFTFWRVTRGQQRESKWCRITFK